MLSYFNIVDLVFLFFTLIFVITALFRGFIKELFAFSNWIISFCLSYALAPYFGDLLKNYIKNKMIADLSARGLIFLVVFLIIAISTSGLVKHLKEAIPRSLDKGLGVLFAFLKTLIIFGLVYSIYANMYGLLLGNKLNEKQEIEHPKILSEAKTFLIIKKWGDLVDPAVKLFFDAISKNIEFAITKSINLDEKMNKMIEDNPVDPEGLNNLINQDSELNKETKQVIPESGYEKKDIDKINNLIETIDKK